MAIPKITLLGMYGYFDSIGDDLFKLLSLPEGMSKETFTDTLFLDYGERAVLYTNPDMFQRMIGAWSAKWSNELTRIAKTLQDDYEPLWNIDRYEAVTDKTTDKAKETNSGSLSEAGTGSGSLSESLTGSGSVTANNGNSSSMTTENQTSAYNSSSYEPKDKTTQSGSGTETISQTTGSNDSRSQTTGNQTSLNQITGSEKNNDYSRDFSHTAHFYGNGGVTMSQQMAESELSLRERYNLYHEACKLFSDDLLLYIY